MCQLVNENVVSMDLLANAEKTAIYLLDAIRKQDFYSAQLELSDLNFAIKRLADIERKKEKKRQLEELIIQLQDRGLNVDFAYRASFLNVSAKNAVENHQNFSKIHKKRQQA